jgi:cytochrome c biogenesis protein ResB
MNYFEFANMLLDSSPNWVISITADYFEVDQRILATQFKLKEGPHQLEVKNKPISVGEFLLYFAGGSSTKIFIVVKLQTEMQRKEGIKQEKIKNR